MPKQDFFAFCTSLKPIELKALGGLSRVEHLGAAETIYSPGEPGHTLYIINRGVVELVEDETNRGGIGTYLSRGDVFGEVEALTDRARRHHARSCEPVSLQSFKRDDFPELLQRIPSFFRFLCNQLANRLAENSAAAGSLQSLQLSGTLANFDLVTIYQTIVNSSQTGELSIRTDSGEVTSKFYFDAGQPRSGQFEHLRGEEAFWQLFLTDGIPGTFSFSSGAANQAEQPEAAEITRAAGDMLIHALQWRDEFEALKGEMFEGAALLERRKPHLSADQVGSAALRPLVEQIWRFSDKRRVPLRSLYPRFEVCELRIYQAVAALVRSGHLALAPSELADKVA